MPLNQKYHTYLKNSVKALILLNILWLGGCSSNIFNNANSPLNDKRSEIKLTGDPVVDGQAKAFRNVQIWGDAYEADKTSLANIIGYAKALASIGSTSNATKILNDGAQIHKKSAEIIRVHAKILSSQGLVGPALRKLLVAVNYAPNDWRIYNDIGGLHSKMGEQKLAVASYTKAIKLSPNNPQIHTNLGVTYMMNKQLILAERHLAIAVKHTNATAKMRQNYAFILGLQGKYEQSKKIFMQDLPLNQVEANIAQIKKIRSKG